MSASFQARGVLGRDLPGASCAGMPPQSAGGAQCITEFRHATKVLGLCSVFASIFGTYGGDSADLRGSLDDVSHAQVLEFEVLLEAVPGALTADAGFLDPAKRGDLGRDHAGVDADHAIFQRLGQLPDAP